MKVDVVDDLRRTSQSRTGTAAGNRCREVDERSGWNLKRVGCEVDESTAARHGGDGRQLVCQQARRRVKRQPHHAAAVIGDVGNLIGRAVDVRVVPDALLERAARDVGVDEYGRDKVHRGGVDNRHIPRCVGLGRAYDTGYFCNLARGQCMGRRRNNTNQAGAVIGCGTDEQCAGRRAYACPDQRARASSIDAGKGRSLEVHHGCGDDCYCPSAVGRGDATNCGDRDLIAGCAPMRSRRDANQTGAIVGRARYTERSD